MAGANGSCGSLHCEISSYVYAGLSGGDDMDETLELKAALGSLVDHLAERGHGGFKQHPDCQACLDTHRAYKLLGVEYDVVEQTTVARVAAMLPMATA